MKLRWRHAVATLVLAGLAGAAAWYATRPETVAVTLTQVTRGRVAETVVNTRAGTVEAPRRARIAPDIAGKVVRLAVREGDRVRAGDVLLELWNADIRAELALARSQAAAAAARADEACYTAENAARTAARKQRLSARGVVPEEERDLAVTESRAAQAACRAARAEADTARARVDARQAALSQTILEAPFAGVVAELNAELGEVVTPSPIGVATPPAVDLIDVGCPHVVAPIDEVDAPAVAVGMPARITLDAFSDRRFDGRVTRIAPYVLDREKQARTVDVTVAFTCDDVAAALLPGYSADAEIILRQREDTRYLPTEAVLEGPAVLRVDPDGIIRRRAIETGLSNWERTEVTAGLEAGERIVLSVNRPGVAAGARAEVAPAGEEAQP